MINGGLPSVCAGRLYADFLTDPSLKSDSFQSFGPTFLVQCLTIDAVHDWAEDKNSDRRFKNLMLVKLSIPNVLGLMVNSSHLTTVALAACRSFMRMPACFARPLRPHLLDFLVHADIFSNECVGGSGLLARFDRCIFHCFYFLTIEQWCCPCRRCCLLSSTSSVIFSEGIFLFGIRSLAWIATK
jgi:hypothetical protein